MSRGLNLEEAERQARELLDARITSVRALVTARQRVTDLREQIGEAEREDARVYAAALADGWTADELRKLGLAEPDRKAAPARRRGGTRRPPAAPATNDGEGRGDAGADGQNQGTT